MSKTYFELDIQGKEELRKKNEGAKPEHFASEKPVEEIKTTKKTTKKTTTIAPVIEEEVEEEVVEEIVEEYPLNEE